MATFSETLNSLLCWKAEQRKQRERDKAADEYLRALNRERFRLLAKLEAELDARARDLEQDRRRLAAARERAQRMPPPIAKPVRSRRQQQYLDRIEREAQEADLRVIEYQLARAVEERKRKGCW